MEIKKKILIVEDEMDFAKMVKLRLQAVGYEVHIAGDAYTGTQDSLFWKESGKSLQKPLCLS